MFADSAFRGRQGVSGVPRCNIKRRETCKQFIILDLFYTDLLRMADRPKGFGMTAEINDKINSKFDKDQATAAMDWVKKITGEESLQYTSKGIAEDLQDGVILCKLINILQPGSVKKISTSGLAFKKMENIGLFLKGCEDYGCKKSDLFQTVNLYESTNIPQVVTCIDALGRMAQKNKFDGPTLGPKESVECKRDFSQEQLEEGKKIIGLQMGSNKGASQAGSTPCGLPRQIEKTNLKI